MSKKPSEAKPKINPNVVPSPTTDDVEYMSNEQIRDALIEHGEKVGPVVDSTRALYKRKLIALRSKPGNKQNVPSTTVSHISTISEPGLSPTQGRESPPDETIPMKGDPIVIAQVTVMSNEMIRTALKEFGNDPGPIVASTRRTYEKKLIKLQTRKIRAMAGDLGDEFSSDDEDMDWCPA